MAWGEPCPHQLVTCLNSTQVSVRGLVKSSGVYKKGESRRESRVRCRFGYQIVCFFDIERVSTMGRAVEPIFLSCTHSLSLSAIPGAVSIS